MLKILISAILLFLFSLLKVVAIDGRFSSSRNGKGEGIIPECHREIQLRYEVENLLFDFGVGDGLSQLGAFFSGGRRMPALRSMRNRHLGLGGREIGFNAGTAHSFTDIEGTKGQSFGKTLNFLAQNPGLSFGVNYRIRVVDWFGQSIGLDFASLSGRNTDVLSAFYNHSFTNRLVEFNYRIIFFAPLPSIRVFDIYGFSGFSMFVNFLSLKNQDGLRLEPDEFRRVQLAIPFGIGFSKLIGNRLVAGYEIGYRHTAFNMLDGVSPPDTRNDAYIFNTLRFGIILNP